MNKPKRNDPCPCGSGKKYKKCCGLSNVITISPEIYNMELEELHNQVLQFAFREYREQLEEEIARHTNPVFDENEDTSNIYRTGLSFWLIMNAPIHDNGTIFDIFYKKQQSKIKHTRTKKLFMEWANVKPSLFDILGTDDTEQKIYLRDVFTKEEYVIPSMENKEDFAKGNLVLGILVPYVQTHHFFLTAIEVFEGRKQDIIKLAVEYDAKQGGLNEHFPKFLTDVLLETSNVNVLTWNNQLHERVADVLTNKLGEKSVDPETISKAVQLWSDYCDKENPVFKKPEAYAAALEYYIHTNFTGESVTQSQLAKEYQTTSGTVSTNYRKLKQAFESNQKEIMEQH